MSVDITMIVLLAMVERNPTGKNNVFAPEAQATPALLGAQA
jgi:hypothetical protein